MRACATSAAVISLVSLPADQHEFVVDVDRRTGHVGHVGHHGVHRHGADERHPLGRGRGPRRGSRGWRGPAVAVAQGQGRDPAGPVGGEARAVADPAARRQVDDPDRPGVEGQDRPQRAPPVRVPGPSAGRSSGSRPYRPRPIRTPSSSGPLPASRPPLARRCRSGQPDAVGPELTDRARRSAGPGRRSGPGRPAPGGATRCRPGGRRAQPAIRAPRRQASAGWIPPRPRPVSSSSWRSSRWGGRRRPVARAAVRACSRRPGSARGSSGRSRSGRSGAGRPRRRAPAAPRRGRGSAARGRPRAARPPRRRSPRPARRAAGGASSRARPIGTAPWP